MKRKTRKIVSFISMMLFPLTLNFFSPYVSIDGALIGVVSGSLMVFVVMTLTGLIFRRAWCSYICPWSTPSNILSTINDHAVDRKKMVRIRYAIFGVWFAGIVIFFILAGGLQAIDPFHMTEKYVSVDEPIKYITYYMVVLLLFLVTVLMGKRGACHTICWMSPFLEFGAWIGEKLRLPQYKIRSKPDRCISCAKCNRVCPMSIDVMNDLRKGQIDSPDCILCGDCVDVCPKQVLSIKIKRKQRKKS
jgi:ferredoxin-type protein NapH